MAYSFGDLADITYWNLNNRLFTYAKGVIAIDPARNMM
jgi:hypothetical protein